MGERAAGPTAKRRRSPQLGAVAPDRGRPKMATEPLPAKAVPTTQGKVRTRATRTASSATTSTRHVGSRAADEDRSHHPGHRGDEDHRHDGRREPGRSGDHGAEDDNLAGGPAPPARSRLDPVRSHPGGPGQVERNERKGGEGDEPVPTARAERAVGQREAEVADDRDDTRPGRQQRAHAMRHPPGTERDAAEEQDALQGPHGPEEHGAGEADEPEGG